MSVDRFQVFSGQPPLLPGSCIICGSSDYSRSYVDFGVQVKKYGRIYFCNECFGDCAKTAGFVKETQYTDQLSINKNYYIRIDELKEENAELRGLIDSRISELRDDLVKYGTKPEITKTPVGRPPKSKPRTPKPDSS